MRSALSNRIAPYAALVTNPPQSSRRLLESIVANGVPAAGGNEDLEWLSLITTRDETTDATATWLSLLSADDDGGASLLLDGEWI